MLTENVTSETPFLTVCIFFITWTIFDFFLVLNLWFPYIRNELKEIIFVLLFSFCKQKQKGMFFTLTNFRKLLGIWVHFTQTRKCGMAFVKLWELELGVS